MLRVHCRCGQTIHADESHLGRRVRCRCGRTLSIQAPRRSPATTLRSRIARELDRLELRLREWRSGRSRQAARGRAPRAGRPRTDHGGWPRGVAARQWLAVAAWGYLAVAIAAAAVVWGLGDRTWFGTVALFGPRWLLLLPLAALVPAALLLRRRDLAPLALAALLVLFPVMGARVGWRGLLAGDAEPELRVATLNAAGDPAAVLRLIPQLEHAQADVAAVQECSQHVPETVARLRDWRVLLDGSFCLLSRHPAESLDVLRFDEMEAIRETGLGGTSGGVRYALHTPSGRVELVNLHLETPRKGLESLRYGLDAAPAADNLVLRQIESRRAAAWVDEGDGSVIILGDFNMPVESAIYRESWGTFHNAFSRVGRGLGMTKDNGWIRVRIDHVLAGREWEATRSWVGADVGSDHWPVFAELRRARR
jgi:vancomycin resistance protein VanJ